MAALVVGQATERAGLQYIHTRHRHGKANPAKAAVARKVLISLLARPLAPATIQTPGAKLPQRLSRKLPDDLAA